MFPRIFKSNYLRNSIKALAEQAACLFIIAFVVRITELLFISNSITSKWLVFIYAIGGESLFILLYLLVLGWILAIIKMLSKTIFKILFSIFLFLLLFLYLSGTQYFYTTQFFLDRIIFYFSFNELQLIASSEAGNLMDEYLWLYIFSIATFLISLFLFNANRLNFYFHRSKALILFVLLIVLALISQLWNIKTLTSNEKAIVVSKPYYFIKDVLIEMLPEEKVENFSASVTTFREFSELPFHPMQNEYPLMRSFDTSTNELANYFLPFDGPPNIVMLFMEGMGSAYSGPDAFYGSMTPNLDSIYSKSLYWPNTLSNTDRTHGIFANILASTPHGFERGITNLKLKEYPQMFSFSKLAYSNGYHGSFIYGGWAYFDNYEPFLKINYLSDIFEEKYFIERYAAKPFEVEGHHSWGIPDKDLLDIYFKLKKDTIESPYLNIILTQSLHSPFLVPDQEKYIHFAKERFQQVNGDLEVFNRNKNAWATIIYVDEAIGDFIEEYKSHPEYENTIFVFVGDHNSQAFSFKNILDMHHVPLAIFSPKLKEAKKFKDIVAHTDIPASLLKLILPYLGEVRLPMFSNWMSSGLSTENTLSAKTPIFIGSFSGDINGVVKDQTLFFRNQLYRIKEGMMLDSIQNEQNYNRFKQALESYKAINKYVLEENKLMMQDGKRLYPNEKADFYFPE